MEQCRKQQYGYLLGDVILNNPRHVCNQVTSASHVLVVWVGVRRQKYTNVDKGIYEYFFINDSFYVRKITLSCNFFSLIFIYQIYHSI